MQYSCRNTFCKREDRRCKKYIYQNSPKNEWKCVKPRRHLPDIRIEKRIHISKKKGLPPIEEILKQFSVIANINVLDDLREWEKERLPLFSRKTKTARVKRPL